MTNEQLAVFIQQGGSNNLIPILWERVKKLLYMKAASFYSSHKEKCARSGVELWDIRQSCYNAFLDALKGYKPERDTKFASYLEFPFKNAVNALLGMQTEKGKREPLNACASLDKPVEQGDGESDPLSEFIYDENLKDICEEIEERSERETVCSVVNSLPEPEKSVIKALYFEEINYRAIGERMTLSVAQVRNIERKAIRLLRFNKNIRNLRDAPKMHTGNERYYIFLRSDECETLKKELRELPTPLSYGQEQAKIYAAFCEWEKEYYSV